jgi:uncharacterized membrane protein YhaH (DUF805 family)
MFACGAVLSERDLLIILSVLTSWLIGLVLFFCNLALIVKLKMPRKTRANHLGVFLGYLAVIILLFLGSFLDSTLINSSIWETIQNIFKFLTFAVPAMISLHFVVLMLLRRKLRNQNQSG